jgi:replicative DNA helicase
VERISLRAEQGLLGAMLIDPDTRAKPLSLVRAEDFADPWHRSVYAALQQVPDGDVVAVSGALVDRVGPRGADLPRVHLLIHDLPVRPDPAGYAVMVIEASLRRQVALVAVLVEACGALDVQAGVRVAGVTSPVKGLIAGLADRYDHAVDVLGGARVGRRATAGTVAPSDPETVRDWCLAADRLLRHQPRRDMSAVRDIEVRFIGSLFAQPDRIGAWADWIRPQWLLARRWAPVLDALQRRAEAGQSLDVVSVAWEVTRASRALGAGPGSEAIHAAAEAACLQDADHLGRQVAGFLLERAAASAAASIRSAANHPGLALPDVVHTANLMIDVVELAAAPFSSPAPAPATAVPPPQQPPAPEPPAAAAPAIGW